jgi:hypothetical protein
MQARFPTEPSPPIQRAISPPDGYVGGGLQPQTDLATDPAGDVWLMNNWQDIDSCFGDPSEALYRLALRAAM